ncbi:MAG: glycerophosphodiester phosphodiesterase [Flavobacterium sp. MedPE-SWcel]|uniref:glycerophosphodiester phosphodiesterase n=1 Tax=uncultured Flavobacterium sp. TaxID=165435 RepID=UPI0009234C9E|nr:glycerophosphodiester phosphodiesterase family protein [uncultured Flavobacterium sp.]OIQ17617.1 MAG: glycerophosphodiester phosphodiesterase [Flavobacterium sp. MedPE-SWcel]
MKFMLKIGHRGAKGHVAENTIASFKKALELGITAVEFDVHVCATGELIVFHDFTVDRTTNGSGEVHEMSLTELRKLTVEGEHKIATLHEVLALLQGKCFVNIEMKGRYTAKPLALFLEQYIKENKYSYNDFIVSSFQYNELKQMSELNPNVALGVLTQASVAQAWDWAVEFSAKAIHAHYSLLTETNVERAREAGFKIHTWTVNEPEDIARIKSYHVDGIISDYPERL